MSRTPTTSNAGAIARTRSVVATAKPARLAERRSGPLARSRAARKREASGVPSCHSIAARTRRSQTTTTPVGERVEPVAQIRRSLEARKELVVAREQACLHGGQFWQGALELGQVTRNIPEGQRLGLVLRIEVLRNG